MNVRNTLEEGVGLQVAAWVPCLVDQYAPHTAEHMMKLLRSQGVTCHYPGQQGCCGGLLAAGGDAVGAREQTVLWQRQFMGCHTVIACGADCLEHVHQAARGDTHMQVRDCADYLVHVLEYVPKNVNFPHKVACIAPRPEPEGAATKELLRAVGGLQLIENETIDSCAWPTLSYTRSCPEVAALLLQQGVRALQSAGVEYVVSNHTSLLLPLQAYCARHHVALHSLHIIDLLAGSQR